MSARSVLGALDPERYDVVQIGITKEGTWIVAGDAIDRLIERATAAGALEGSVEGTETVALLADPSRGGRLLEPRQPASDRWLDAPIDVVFPLVHGRTGEDGALQGLFDLAGVAYVGAGILGSALGMDKVVAKRLWAAGGLPVAPYLTFRTAEWRAEPGRYRGEVAATIGFPCFVKPANSGSSIGVVKIHAIDELPDAIDEAARYDLKLLVEKAIDGRELECGVVGNERPEASVVGEVVPGHEFYDYEDKYFDDAVRLIVPAELPPGVSDEVRGLAVQAFRAVEASGMARVDVFLEHETGKVWLNEINTIPGFTEKSMFPRLWDATGVPYPELCDRLIELAVAREDERRAVRATR